MAWPGSNRRKADDAELARVRSLNAASGASSRSADSLLRGPVSTIPTRDSAGGAPVVRTVGATLKRGAKVFGSILGVLGAVTLLNYVTGGAVNQMFGLLPRTSRGAWGILLHPLLHAGAAHLTMNAIGIVLMGGTVFLRSERDFWRVTLLGTLVGGGGTWLFGHFAMHVGASGVVFAYLGYLLTTGWFDRKLTAVALSITAAILWGSALFGLSPLQHGISWELHLFGMLGGILGAWWRKRTAPS